MLRLDEKDEFVLETQATSLQIGVTNLSYC